MIRPTDPGHGPRLLGDPPADDFVANFISQVAETERVTELKATINFLRGDADLRPSWISNWVNAHESPPDWASQDLIARGQQFFKDNSLDITVALFCASLPYSYAVAQGVEVLERTSELARAATITRRIAETGQMLLDVTGVGALDVSGRGYRRVREIRLLHATIRALLLLPPIQSDSVKAWSITDFGCPINQEDMLGTLLAFTTAVFQSLRRMGVRVPPEHEAAYLHLWSVIGYYLGIEAAGSITGIRKSEELANSLFARLSRSSSAGRHLMCLLMSEMESSMPGGLFRLPRTLVRFLIGERVADLLGVPPAAWWSAALKLAAALDRWIGNLPGGPALLTLPSRLIGRSVIRMWIDLSILHERTPPQIDRETLRRWRIRTSPDRTTLTFRGRMRRRRRGRRELRDSSGKHRNDRSNANGS